LDFPESEKANEDETFKEETKNGFSKPAPGRSAICGGYIGKDSLVMRKHQVPVAMRPVKTLKSLLVHPKDKQEKEQITDCVYKIPCASSEKCYIGETGRKFGIRLKEHKTEARQSNIFCIRTLQKLLANVARLTVQYDVERFPVYLVRNHINFDIFGNTSVTISFCGVFFRAVHHMTSNKAARSPIANRS